MSDREIQLIETFVVPSKRERYEGFLRSAKNRKKFLDELYHFRDFIPDCVVELSGRDGTATGVIAELRRRGASGECYLISADAKLDGATRSLRDAIWEASEGTLVCCVPGRLAYYEGEAPKNSFILHRRL
jgi:hypothetical protein